MIALSRGNGDDAIQAFESEIASGRDHLYSAEFELGARLGLGFTWLAMGRPTDAIAAFDPLVAGDGFGRALLGLALSYRRSGNADGAGRALAAVSRVTAMLRRAGRNEHAQMLDAGAHVASGDEEKALALLASAVAGAAPGPFGWTLWIDPVFTPLHGKPAMARILADIASRAT
jgi:tetratricopeptide (TPR) repeat protein